VAQDFVELVQTGVLGERVVLEELGLPAVEAAQTPGGGGDLLDVVVLEEVARAELFGEFVGDLLVAVRVFAEAGEDDVTGEQSVGGGVAAGDGFAVFGGGDGGVSSQVARCLLYLSTIIMCMGTGVKGVGAFWQAVGLTDGPGVCIIKA